MNNYNKHSLVGISLFLTYLLGYSIAIILESNIVYYITLILLLVSIIESAIGVIFSIVKHQGGTIVTSVFLVLGLIGIFIAYFGYFLSRMM